MRHYAALVETRTTGNLHCGDRCRSCLTNLIRDLRMYVGCHSSHGLLTQGPRVGDTGLSDLGESLRIHGYQFVIPTFAGRLPVQCHPPCRKGLWIPAFAGMTEE